MKILHLTLKKKWFDMIESGEKDEEYREIKPYWDKRLCGHGYDAVQFRNGYSLHAPVMLVQLIRIIIGVGKKWWGAPDYPVYIIHLGRIIKKNVTKLK